LKDLILKLLIKDKEKRMGKFEELKAHPFFKGFDWENLLEKKIKAPLIPICDGMKWLQNFDDIDDEGVEGKSIAESIVERYQDLFKEYDF